jgi:hypothetical protein
MGSGRQNKTPSAIYTANITPVDVAEDNQKKLIARPRVNMINNPSIIVPFFVLGKKRVGGSISGIFRGLFSR